MAESSTTAGDTTDTDLPPTPDSTGTGSTTTATSGARTSGDVPNSASGDETLGGGSSSAEDGADATESGESTGRSPGECGAPPRGGDVPIVDDLEHPGVSIPVADGRQGSWFSYNDGTAGGIQWPTPLETTADSAYAGSRSIRTYGSGFTNFGAALGVSLNASDGFQCPYDASAWDGITFWARGEGTIRVQVGIPATTPIGPDGGGTCDPDGGDVCYDEFGTTIELTGDWLPYILPWGDLAQSGWGTAAVFDPSQVITIAFRDETADPFDIWVDELAFFAASGGEGDSETGNGSDGGPLQLFSFEDGTEGWVSAAFEADISGTTAQSNTFVTEGAWGLHVDAQGDGGWFEAPFGAPIDLSGLYTRLTYDMLVEDQSGGAYHILSLLVGPDYDWCSTPGVYVPNSESTQVVELYELTCDSGAPPDLSSVHAFFTFLNGDTYLDDVRAE